MFVSLENVQRSEMQSINKNNHNISSVQPLFNIKLNEVLTGKSSDYSVQAFLGQGAFGKVARCKNLKTNELVAVKVVRKDFIEPGRREAEALEKVGKRDADKN